MILILKNAEYCPMRKRIGDLDADLDIGCYEIDVSDIEVDVSKAREINLVDHRHYAGRLYSTGKKYVIRWKA